MSDLGLDSGDLDVIVLHDGTTLQTHGPARCGTEFCCIHKPSVHPLMNRPLIWRGDCYPPFMERLCEHGIGHPDPDSLAYLQSRAKPQFQEDIEALWVHGCDGCCQSVVLERQDGL